MWVVADAPMGNAGMWVGQRGWREVFLSCPWEKVVLRTLVEDHVGDSLEKIRSNYDEDESTPVWGGVEVRRELAEAPDGWWIILRYLTGVLKGKDGFQLREDYALAFTRLHPIPEQQDKSSRAPGGEVWEGASE
ncbi:hypothetical protein C8F04DRAFT_1200129 [Mycena alexandri]|uniref:Uncharacterized protein n=1 Tax=Mycena alexandri TaxID=1745969 RepID=A0AAD6RYH0_9AGAR|nr:hypothetical protein C8F04DRAFT_1200129 [Mycena alexandri]